MSTSSARVAVEPLLALELKDGETLDVYAVCKRPHPPYTVAAGVTAQQVNTYAIRPSAREAQEICDYIEDAQRYVLYLEFLCMRKATSGGSSELEAVESEADFREFIKQMWPEDTADSPHRLYHVEKMKVVEKLPAAAV